MSRPKFVEVVSELDGRSDPTIKDYYVETNAQRRIRDEGLSAVGLVGLKGSGKSTLFRVLTEDWSWEPKTIRIGLSPSQSEFEGFVDRVNCLQFANSVEQGMALHLIDVIDQNIRLLPVAERANTAKWLERKATLLRPGSAALDLMNRFRGLSILGCGFEVADPQARDRRFEVRSLARSEADQLWKLLKDFEQYGIRVRIVVDDPDRLFVRDGRADPQLLAGYVLGTNQITKRLRYVQFVHIIKSNVYEELQEVEEIANLPDDYFEYISWSKSELEDLVMARIRFSGALESEIFDPSVKELMPILCERIRNGPRDLLRYLEIIVKSGPDVAISEGTVDAHSGRFKRAARKQMQTIYGEIYEGIEPFLNTIFSSNVELTYSAFRERFLQQRMQSQPSGVDYEADWLRSAERAFRALIEAGTVDVCADGAWKRPYEAGYFIVDSIETACVRRTAVFA